MSAKFIEMDKKFVRLTPITLPKSLKNEVTYLKLPETRLKFYC